jgi:uncharacterized membrane protein YbhN (UPF0104 family)
VSALSSAKLKKKVEITTHRRPDSRRAEPLPYCSNSCYVATMNRRAKLLIKCAVTAFLFWLVVHNVDVASLSALLDKARPAWLAVSLALVLAMTALDALAFCIVMRILGHRVRLGTSFLYSFVSWFFSNLAPSTLGGDIFRTMQMQRLGAPLGTALRSVLTARMLSFAALVPVILLGLPIALNVVDNDAERMALMLIAALGSAALLAAYCSFLVIPRLRGLVLGPLASRIAALAVDFRQVNHAGWNTIWCWVIASGQHATRVAVLAALAASLDLGIPFATLFALLPAALLVAMIPISLGSWGLREAAFVVFLGGASIVPEAALSLSIAFGLLRVAVGGLAGLTWLLTDRKRYGIELDVNTDRNFHMATRATEADEAGAVRTQ